MSAPTQLVTSMSFRGLLAERNAIAAQLNEGPDVDDATSSAVCGRINVLETELFEREAQTADDAVMKLIAAAQVAAEGQELNEEIVDSVILAAARHFGIGYVHYKLRASLPALAPLPATDRHLWDEAAATYHAALAAENAYDAEHIDGLDLPVGPERSKALSAVPAHVWTESARLSDIRCAAEDRLLELPSPDAAAFALKVVICRDDNRDLNGMDDRLVAEARTIIAGGAA